MMMRLLMGAAILAVAACATPVSAPAPEAVAEVTACRDIVRSAGMHAYALAKFRDDQRAVILLPAGKAAAEYEAETKRLRDEGARLMAAYPQAEGMPAVQPGSATEAEVAARIAEADACLTGEGK